MHRRSLFEAAAPTRPVRVVVAFPPGGRDGAPPPADADADRHVLADLARRREVAQAANIRME